MSLRSKDTDGTWDDVYADQERMLQRLESQVVRSRRRKLHQGSGRYHITIGLAYIRGWHVHTERDDYYGDSLREVLEKSNCPWVGWEE